MGIGDTMRFFVTGANGQLGHDVMEELIKRGHEGIGSGTTPVYSDTAGAIAGLPYVPLDITDAQETEHVLMDILPDAVIHCAAWTDVDGAEDEENIPRVYEINAKGTKYVANACKRLGCKMLYISTDYVFDGSGTEPWHADCRDYAPLNVYGRTKLEGELAVSHLLENYFIIRIAWTFGINGHNFVKTMLNAAQARDSVRVVDDQIGTPTYTRDLARLLVDMAGTEKYGYYHATNEGGYISWYDLACEVYRQAGISTRVVPVSTEEYGYSRAKRPFNSRLDKSALRRNGFAPLPDWKDAVARYLRELHQ